MIMSF